MSGGRGKPSTIVDKDEGLGKVNNRMFYSQYLQGECIDASCTEICCHRLLH